MEDESESKHKISSSSNNDVNEKLDYIIKKLADIEFKIDRIEEENKIRDEKNSTETCKTSMAVNKIQREIFGLGRQMYKVVGIFAGQSSVEANVEIEATFPINTLAQMRDLELRLKNIEFAANVENYLRKMKGKLETLFRFIATDDFYIEFNLDGKAGKKSLNSLIIFKKILFETYGEGREEYNKEMRRCVLKSHNRFFKQKNN